MKQGTVVIIILMSLFLVSGCSNNYPLDIERDTEPRLVNHDENNIKVDSLSKIDEINEFAIYVGDNYYPVNSDYVLQSILEGRRSEDTPEDFPYPSGKIHYGDELTVFSFKVDDERGKGEIIYRILATKDAKTPRGVGIGSTLSELEAAYSDLKYEANWLPDGSEPEFNRVYIYEPEGSRVYIAFFLHNKEIVMIEVKEGSDYMPGSDIEKSNILGVTGVIKEVSNMSSKGAEIKYIFTNKSGEEEILLDIYARSVYEADLDGDGITELMVYLPGEMQSIRIYDRVDGEISYIDVNEKLESLASFGMEDMSGYQREYENCLLAIFQNEDGGQRMEVYKVINNELIHVGLFTPK